MFDNLGPGPIALGETSGARKVAQSCGDDLLGSTPQKWCREVRQPGERGATPGLAQALNLCS